MTDVIIKREDGTLDVGLLCDDPSLTKQADADACNINKIMAKYEKDGVLQHVNVNQGFYADVSKVPDYQGCLAVVKKAEELFMSIPAEIRAKFDHDPQKYFDFVSDPANGEEMVKLGLRQVKEPDKPMKVEVVNPPVVAEPKA